MHTSQNFTQLQTIFGNGYVPEQHADETHPHLPLSEKSDFAMSFFDETLKSLRDALSLRSGA